jgi:Zn-dependent protease with chaperone function
MRLYVYVPFLACVASAMTAHALARRNNPRVAAIVLICSGVILAGASSAALSLLAFPALAQLPLVASLGHWSATAVPAHVPVPTWLAVLAFCCVIAIVIEVGRVLMQYVGGLTQALRVQRASRGAMIVVDDPAVYAYACRPWPWRRGVVIISDGLQRALDEDERAAVLAHEQSHLAHHHGVFQLVSQLIAAINPLLRPLQREIAFCIERWADEDAAVVSGRNVAAAALATSADRGTHAPPSFGLAHSTSNVCERVQALLDEPPTRDGRFLTTIGINAVIAVGAVCLAAHSTELIFEALRR